MLCSLRMPRLRGGSGSALTLRSTAGRSGLGRQNLCRRGRDRLPLELIRAPGRHRISGPCSGGVFLDLARRIFVGIQSGVWPAAVGIGRRAGAPEELTIHQHCQLAATARIQESPISSAVQRPKLMEVV